MTRKQPDYVHPNPEVYKLVTSFKFEFLGGVLIMINSLVL